MAQIGSFTRDDAGNYTGTVCTSVLKFKAVMKPCSKEHEKAPDYRITTSNGADVGAGWTKAARETGAEYLSVKLDDPAFPAPIYATLVQGDRGEHKLIWSR